MQRKCYGSALKFMRLVNLCTPVRGLYYKFPRVLYTQPFTRLPRVPFIHTMSLIRSRQQRAAFHPLPIHAPRLSKVWQLFIFHYTVYSPENNPATFLHSRL